MSYPTFVQDAMAGFGSYAAVYHVAGTGWAVSSNPRFVKQLNGLGTMGSNDILGVRRSMFGSQLINATAPASYVQLLPTLSFEMGAQGVTFDESVGLTGSDWTVSFGREASGSDYTFIRQHSVPGIYDALDIIPDPAYDGRLGTGRLSATFDPSIHSLKWIDDEGLATSINAQIALFPPGQGFGLVWVGSTCLAIGSAPSLSGNEYTASAFVALRCANEKLWPSSTDIDSVMIASAPFLGIVGLPANLWLLRVDPETGIPYDCDANTGDPDDYPLPIQFNTGRVCPNPKGTPTSWSIKHKHWLEWMNTQIPFGATKAKLTGYRFSRQPASFEAPDGTTITDTGSDRCQTPHMCIMEWDSGTSAYVYNDIWLCDNEAHISFDNLNDLLDAVNDELDNATHSDSTARTYRAEMGKLINVSPDPTHPTFITGPIPWIFGWGQSLWPPGGDTKRAPYWEIASFCLGFDADDVAAGNVPNGCWRFVQDSSVTKWPSFLTETFGESLADLYTGIPMSHYYQWDFTTANFCNQGWHNTHGFWRGNNITLEAGATGKRGVPIAYDSITTSYRLNLDLEYDATSFVDDEPITIGDIGIRVGNTVDSTGTNYILTDAGASSLFDSVPLLLIDPANISNVTWPFTFMGVPWLGSNSLAQDINQSTVAEDGTLETLYRGILGDETNGISMASKSRLWHIPDAFAYVDMRELIDWTTLANLSDGIYPSSVLQLPQSGDFNVKEAFFGSLQTHGIRPTWGYSEIQRAWRMSFEPAGIVSGTQAVLAGRVITDDVVMTTDPSTVHGNTWLYEGLNCSTNFGQDGKPKLIIPFTNTTGRAAVSGNKKVLDVEDPFLWIEDADLVTLATTMQSLIARLNVAPTEINIELTPSGMVSCEAGSSVLITTNIAWNIYTGARGVSDIAALVKGYKILWKGRDADPSGGKLIIQVALRITPYTSQGWSPSLRLTGGNQSLASTTVTLTGLPVTASTSEFVDPTKGLTDLATFGCFTWSAANGLDERGCSCSPYAVRIVDTSIKSAIVSGASRNTWTGTIEGSAGGVITLADLAAGTANIKLDDATNYDDTTGKIVLFRERSFASLQDCQTIYGALGDDAGKVYDGDGNEYRAFIWV